MAVPTLFDQQASGDSTERAYWLARACDLAYKERPVIEAQATTWGFSRVRHHETAFTPPFPLQDTQAYTMAGPRMVVTAFRGTEPAQIKDWLTDASTPSAPGPAGIGYVHYGFAEALASILPTVHTAIEELRTDGQRVYFTGHSLGGALAMLAAAHMSLEDPQLAADGVYTYGQPRTCDRLLAAAYNKGLKDRVFRFVNNNDIVPTLPPEPAFTHVAALRYLDHTGKLHTATSMLAGLKDKAAGLTADAFAPASDGIRDHFMASYLTALEKNLS
ncbi:lipase family protein [Streptomyces sp. NPDC054766]|uniref:lipase family protein n=1 Tax=Streptomyces rhizosphaerihabitans TaxID=1266770 RepID=UPI0021C14912|nr:lipase family protein [Streptomyces rhizosphaerihabitans]MCT9010304.1 lipase family protein [Streptomyces rhizosphaerihabitans]